MANAIWWVRRDLRLEDNPALRAAGAGGRAVAAVFLLDERLLRRSAPARLAFLFDGLRALDASLRSRGSRLLVRSGRPEQLLADLLAETGAEVICAEEDYSPFSRRRDEAVAARLPLERYSGLTVHHPAAVVKPDGKPYTVFTPFRKAWMALPRAISHSSDGIAFVPAAGLPVGEPLPSMPAAALGAAGEAEAHRRLRTFLDGPILDYAEGRNRLDTEGTSTLSPYFRFGMLSPARALAEALHAAAQASGAARQSVDVWITELIWREFYQSILYHFPTVLRAAFRPALRAVSWRDAPQDLLAWQEGRTGYPVVDAAMRQLLSTGWMHNRARMITASFLAKDLLINWQEGERWFFQMLVDGDPAANNGGWQWTAGVGTDAAPYFRVFNPVLQGQKFDPQGDYVRRWVPELRDVPSRWIHAPWEMPAEAQAAAGCRIGWNYPAPMVDHSAARARALAAYQRAGGQEVAL